MTMLPGFSEVLAYGSDEQWTPSYIFTALQLQFDLDPCAPVGGVPWVPANSSFSKLDDGLAQEWTGVVWLNPPYSKPGPWMQRMAAHGNGIALVMADVTRGWFREYGRTAELALFLDRRVDFVLPGGAKQQHAPFPSVLLGWGPDNCEAIIDSGLGWIPNMNLD